MPRTKKAIINFFQIYDENHVDGQPPFQLQGIVDIVTTIPDRNLRHRDVSSYVVRIEDRFHAGGNIYTYEVIKVRSSDLPSLMNHNGDLVDLVVDGRSLAEHTAFLLYPANNIIAVLRSGYGPSAENIIQYLQQFAPAGVSLAVNQVLQANAMARLQRLDEVRRLNFRIARLGNEAMAAEPGSEIDDVPKVMRVFGGRKLEASLSIGGRRQGSLLGRNAKRFTNDIVAHFLPQQIEVLQLEGIDEDGNPDMVDMVTDRLYYRATMEIDEARNRVARETRHQALEDAFTHHSDFLRGLR